MSTAILELEKTNPLWDGDGLQGAGQPRDRMGRWVRLPGKSALKKIGAWELDDGSFGVFKDDEETPFKVYRRKASANKHVADAIKLDAKLYAQKVVAPKHVKMRSEEAKREQAIVAERAPRQSGLDLVPAKGRATKKPPMQTTRVNVSENDQLPVSGRPTQAQVNDANKWARQTMKPEEANYAGLITRLLKNKGITQNPRMRGQMSQRHGIPANRLIEIEQQVYDKMFPKATPGRRLTIQGKGTISPGQLKTVRSMGGRKTINLSSPDNVHRPKAMFKANKGENRGKWILMQWNGSPDVIDENVAAQHAIESKAFWTSWLFRDKASREKQAAARRAAQEGLLDAALQNAAAQKEWKIARAQKWARENGFDENDTYWWGVFWNDPSLIKGGEAQEGEVAEDTKHLKTNLAPVIETAHMNPALLEGLLALPDDFNTRKMRGQRPEGRHARKDDEDFTPAGAEARQGGEEWESRNRDRENRYVARMRRRYEKYKTKHPKSKMSYAQFKDAIEQGAIVKSSNPLWDGDGVQGVGQPRGRGGRWIGTHVTEHAEEIIQGGFDLDKSGKWVQKFGKGVYLGTSAKDRSAYYISQKKKGGKATETLNVVANVKNTATVDADKRGSYLHSDPISILKTIPGYEKKRKELFDAYKKEYERRGGFMRSTTDDNFYDNWPTGIPKDTSIDPTDVLIALGYDSLHIKQNNFTKLVGGDQLIVFNPKKVKVSRREVRKRRILKAKNPLWEGDKFQPPGQPRDFHGRFTDTGRTALGAFERVMRHTGSRPARMASSGKGMWDHKNKTLAPGVKLTRLPHQGSEVITGPDGKSLAKKKMTPEAAIYARNNGTTKITDKRLAEIYDSMFRKGSDAKPMTPTERDLLLSAGAREAQDGDSHIRVWIVRQRKFVPKTRFFLMNTIRKETGLRAAKGDPNALRGERGHVIRRTDISDSKKQAENAKRVASGRHKVNGFIRQQIMDDFGDGRTAKCIFCGRPVHIDELSVERMKPGPIGGKYDRGNMAPAHLSCNTKVGHKADKDPTGYYDDMMKKFLMRYQNKIKSGSLNFVFSKHRGKLAGKR